MTDSHVTGAQKALARRVLSRAIGGGSSHWARVHGYQWNCPADQGRADGVDVRGQRRLWRADLDDIAASVDAIISATRDTGLPAEADAGPAASAAARLAAATCDRAATEQIPRALADIALQVAVAGQVIYR